MTSQDAGTEVPDPTARGGEIPSAHDTPSRGVTRGGPKGTKSQKGRVGLQNWLTLVTRSEETHTSATHEDADEEEKDDPSLKGKREASEHTEARVRPKGQKRFERNLSRGCLQVIGEDRALRRVRR